MIQAFNLIRNHNRRLQDLEMGRRIVLYPGGAPDSFDFPWKFTQDSGTGGVILPGTVYDGGNPVTITSPPTDWTLSGIVNTTKFWIALNFSAASATWVSGSTLPASVALIEYWHVLTLTCTDSVITGIFQPWPCDIHTLLNP